MKHVIALVAALAVSLPVAAFACGGMFCSVPPGPTTAPEPVDQNAERILFEVHGDGTVTAHVGISYVGSADQFAWVVPMPSEPVQVGPEPTDFVALSSDDVFAALDQRSQLTVTFPPQEACAVANGGGGGIGCGASDSAGASNDDGGEFGGPGRDGPVTVFGTGNVGPFEFASIGAENTIDLIDWLRDNNYNVSENMTPVMDVYNGPEASFLALRLSEDAQVSEITPVRMRYTGDCPMIPIELTAVAAQPLMGIQVWVASDEAPYVPSNYAWDPPDTTEILYDSNNRTNYFEWVAREADEMEGRFFSAEFIGQLGNLGTFDDYTIDYEFMTRFYTRLSPHNMRVDPTFEADPDAAFTGPNIDLSQRQAVLRCGSPIANRQPSACAFNYCGAGSECVVLDGEVGCDCADGEIAQRVGGPDGIERVTCVPDNPYAVPPTAFGPGTEFDPCASADCGSGTCVIVGGFPTCLCDDGAAACLEPNNTVSCVPIPADTPTFGPGAGVESERTGGPLEGFSAAPMERSTQFASFGFGTLLVFAGLVGLRRRYR